MWNLIIQINTKSKYNFQWLVSLEKMPRSYNWQHSWSSSPFLNSSRPWVDEPSLSVHYLNIINHEQFISRTLTFKLFQELFRVDHSKGAFPKKSQYQITGKFQPAKKKTNYDEFNKKIIKMYEDPQIEDRIASYITYLCVLTRMGALLKVQQILHKKGSMTFCLLSPENKLTWGPSSNTEEGKGRICVARRNIKYWNIKITVESLYCLLN